jgi:hypothetical protein
MGQTVAFSTMWRPRGSTIAASAVFLALALAAVAGVAGPTGLAGVAGAQSSSPSAAEVSRAKAGLVKFSKAHAPKTEAKPTTLAACPFGGTLMADLAAAQTDYSAAAGAPTVAASVFVDQTIDKGTRAISCTAQYTDTQGASQTLGVAAYADPGLQTPAFAKGLAKQTKGKVKAMDPPSPKLAGGKAEGYCVVYPASKQCAYVWSRNGLYVEMDTGSPQAANFTALRNLVLSAVAALPDASVGAG